MIPGNFSVSLILVFLSCALISSGATPVPPRTPEPMVPSNRIDIVREGRVVERNGSSHVDGQFHLLAEANFNSGALLELDARVELISDSASRSGERHLIALAPDANVDAIIEALRGYPAVRAVSRSYPVQFQSWPNDPYWRGQYEDGMSLMNLPPAWDVSRGASEVRVAVVDHGVNEIPELAGVLDDGCDFRDLVCGEDTSDPDGHGTQVATLIAGKQNNGAGIAGIAPNVRIVPLKVCCTTPILLDAFRWVRDENEPELAIHVVNISAVYAHDSTVESAIQRIADQGTIVVASAGNFGESAVRFPANMFDVVAVGGVSPTGERHSSSNYGIDLDVAAPMQSWSRDHEDNATLFWGTSAAAAIISGVAALYMSTSGIDEGTFVRNTSTFLASVDYWSPQPGWNESSVVACRVYISRFGQLLASDLTSCRTIG